MIRTYDDTLIMGISTTVIPDTVVAINHYAFCNCSGLQSITIPDNVNLLKERAFGFCIYNHRTTKTNQKYPSVNL